MYKCFPLLSRLISSEVFDTLSCSLTENQEGTGDDQPGEEEDGGGKTDVLIFVERLSLKRRNGLILTEVKGRHSGKQ